MLSLLGMRDSVKLYFPDTAVEGRVRAFQLSANLLKSKALPAKFHEPVVFIRIPSSLYSKTCSEQLSAEGAIPMIAQDAGESPI